MIKLTYFHHIFLDAPERNRISLPDLSVRRQADFPHKKLHIPQPQNNPDLGLIGGVFINPNWRLLENGKVLKNSQNSESQNLNLQNIALNRRTLP
jgi:hypothetical protein